MGSYPDSSVTDPTRSRIRLVPGGLAAVPGSSAPGAPARRSRFRFFPGDLSDYFVGFRVLRTYP